MKTKEKRLAVAYLRTSTSNAKADKDKVGEEYKDSDKRQRAAIADYAKRAKIEIVTEYYDDAVSGADHIDVRKGFKEMMEHLLSNGVRTIIVETASRFARDIVVQEIGHRMLKAKGIELIAADAPDSFLDDTPSAKAIRQMLGVMSEFEKAMLVSKLRGAKERKKATGVKVDGRKSHAERKGGPELVALAKQLRRKRPKGGQQSYRKISAEMFAAGHANTKGKPYSASAIRSMLIGRAA